MRPVHTCASRRNDAGDCLTGCLVAVVVVLVALAVLLVAGFFVARSLLDSAIENYTAAEPAALPVQELTDEQWAALEEKAIVLQDALQGDWDEMTIELTGDELNALIQTQPEAAQWRDHVYLTVDGSQLRAQVSLPLDRFNLPSWLGLQGRYLNGDAAVTVAAENGQIVGHLEELVVNGATLPATAMAQIRDQNILENITNDPKLRPYVRYVDSIDVNNSTLRVHLKQRRAGAGAH